MNEATAKDDEAICEWEPAPFHQYVADPHPGPDAEQASKIWQRVDEASVQNSCHAIGAEPEGQVGTVVDTPLGPQGSGCRLPLLDRSLWCLHRTKSVAVFAVVDCQFTQLACNRCTSLLQIQAFFSLRYS